MAEESDPDPGSCSPRLAIERYLRYRLVETEHSTDGWYTRLRSFVEWCERVGVDTVGALRSSTLLAYYEHRRSEVDPETLEHDMRTIEQFCQFLVEVEGLDDLAATVPEPPAVFDDRQSIDSGGSAGSGATVESTASVPCGDRLDRSVPTGSVEYEIGSHEAVTTAVLRAVSAVDGRPIRFLPPLGNVLDTGALDTLFEATSDGTPRTGGRLSFVYGGCRVTLQSEEFLRIQPLDPSSSNGQGHPWGSRSMTARRDQSSTDSVDDGRFHSRCDD
jgi:hypothetical protein